MLKSLNLRLECGFFLCRRNAVNHHTYLEGLFDISRRFINVSPNQHEAPNHNQG